MQGLKEQIEALKKQLNEALKAVSSSRETNAIHVNFLGKKGSITKLLGEIKKLSIEEKRTFGPLLNKFKKESEEFIQKKYDDLFNQEIKHQNLKKENFDVTAYKTGAIKGHVHPYTKIIEEIENIFLSMGYEILDGPEVETDYYNFTALNVPENHPARDMYDTFWTNLPNTLLRTHTSPIQIHAMENKKLPVAVAATGRGFRHEATDASHDIMFMQCEGFLVGENISLANLFATAKKFLRALLNRDDLNIRIRPGFFPFVEPGVEIDMECPFCKKGCSVCKKTKWIEIFPGGLIHPNVLKACKIDPEKYSGFAFGFGLTRLAMIKYGINNIRLFHSGKMKFLEQF
ncbi:phenylalanine--tRNA ligase subunit alpha [Candidatus Babeliales bacterium]|nr:phenylalanine--tRNA ligase subunit alpha [Candidatus Babeliales bacterium]